MRIHSEEITLTSAHDDDLVELDELYAEACGFFNDEWPLPLHTPAECLSGSDLPEGGLPENYELLTIRINGMLIGYTAIYRDFPGKEYVDISFIYIGERARGCGFGTRAAGLLCTYFAQAGYRRMRVHGVSLRSWGALRFWDRLGFDRVIGLDAAGEHDDGGFGSVSLEKQLSVLW